MEASLDLTQNEYIIQINKMTMKELCLLFREDYKSLQQHQSFKNSNDSSRKWSDLFRRDDNKVINTIILVEDFLKTHQPSLILCVEIAQIYEFHWLNHNYHLCRKWKEMANHVGAFLYPNLCNQDPSRFLSLVQHGDIVLLEQEEHKILSEELTEISWIQEKILQIQQGHQSKLSSQDYYRLCRLSFIEKAIPVESSPEMLEKLQKLGDHQTSLEYPKSYQHNPSKILLWSRQGKVSLLQKQEHFWSLLE